MCVTNGIYSKHLKNVESTRERERERKRGRRKESRMRGKKKKENRLY